MRKIYVLDTSSLIDNPEIYKNFPNSDVVIPIVVINELDKKKLSPGKVGKNARVCIRVLDQLSNLGNIDCGIQLDNDVLLKIDSLYNKTVYDGFGDPNYPDTQILICAFDLFKQGNDVTLVSNDLNLRLKAKSRGINATGNMLKKFSFNDLYSGERTVVNEAAGLDLQKAGFIDPVNYGLYLLPNECISFRKEDGNCIALGRKVADKIKLIKKSYPWNLSSRNNEQSYAIDMIMDKDIDLITLIGRAGTGKAQPLDAKILTPTGWILMGSLIPGDDVIGSDGTAKKVLGIFPQGNKKVFKVNFSDGSSTECCEDHLWYTKTRKEEQRSDNVGSVKSLKEIKETLKAYKTEVNNHKIPLVNAVKFIKKDFVIHPYIMGVLLGDGTVSEKYSVYFTSTDKEIVDKCQSLLPSNIICKSKSDNNYSFIVKNNLNRNKREDNIFAREISKLELLGTKSRTKFIPKEYKFSSVDDRLNLLQGLMDTDGTVSLDGSDVSYSTTSNQLAEDVKFLVQSLGGLAKINKKCGGTYINKVKINDLESNIVSISLPRDFCPFKLQRKIDRYKSRKYDLSRMITDIECVGEKETQCILIDSDDHLYVTDDFILTHNTLITLASALELVLNKKEYEKLVIYRPIQCVGNDIGFLPGTMEEKLAPWFTAIMDNFETLFACKNSDWRRDLELYQKKHKIEMEAITYIRGRSIPNSIMFIDEVQNISKQDIKTILTRAGEGTKLILSGDIDQIDSDGLDATNNGLTYIIEKFKDYDLSGHMTFTQGERSRLATLASEILT
jgi:predicted ribonuclease YlaK